MTSTSNYSDARKVLVVEDDPGWLGQSKIRLERKNYVVGTALTKEAAIEQLDQCLYHTAIVDLKLKEDDPNDREGLRVIEHIWKMNEGTRVIVRSGYAHETSVINEMIKYGIKGLTEKDMGFVKDGVNKGADNASTVEFFSAVDAAVEEAQKDIQRAGARTVWENSPFSFINGMLARDIQLAMGGGAMSELRGFLGELVESCAPWLQVKDKDVLIPLMSNPSQIDGYQTAFWSRALGRAVLIRFYRQNYKQNAESVSPQSLVKFGQVKQLIWTNESQHFAGELYFLDNADFRLNFRSPIPKRTPEH